MRKNTFLKALSLAMCLPMVIIPLNGCGDTDNSVKEPATVYVDNGNNKIPEKEVKTLKLTFDEKVTYQTIESFGASGAWWSQDVGGWTGLNDDGVEVREQIATLLFDDEKGIGLSAYRYNIGAGTADSGASFEGITDIWRRAESFETAPGEYDWTKDENAVWFMNRAREMGVSEIVFFCNSPLERLTKNGKGYGDEAADGGTTSNLPKENYREFAEYVMDVVEHFVSEGYPIKYVSPINEPQWGWTGGQEGCHYEPEELVEFLNVFLDVMEERKVEGVELSAPELGEWGNTSYAYYKAIFADERLKNEIKTLDVHSYWSDTASKIKFAEWVAEQGITDLELKTSEWCEMVNGKDMTMDSAVNQAIEMNMDLTKLNVTSWQYWIAVSCYSYRDGLIYVNTNTKDVWETKRLWAMGNYSRFIKEGYTRIESTLDDKSLAVSAFKGNDGNGKENLVIVIVNPGNNECKISTSDFGEWTNGNVYVTDESHSLEKTEDLTGETILIPPVSVVTVTLTK